MESSPSLLRSSGIITGDSKFTSGCQWFSLMLVILEPHIKKRRPPISVNSVCKDLYTVLCAAKDELDNSHSGFWRSLATDAKNEPNLNFFMTDKGFGGSV